MMNWDKEPNLKEFATTFNDYVKEIGCMDNAAGYIASHNIVGRIRVVDVDDVGDADYEIVGLDIGQVGGCGCWSDILIFIKRIEE